MRESPRIRRLRSDFRSVSALRADSSILEFETEGDPPEHYTLRFLGRGLSRPRQEVVAQDIHMVSVGLGAGYPRMIPDLTWRTPIFHPNISGSGVVCLGGYGSHWVPAVGLDDLCVMLWDMIRYQNFDIESPYNREAAAWARAQTTYRLPMDARPLRDKLARIPPEQRVPQNSPSRQADVLFLEDPSPGSGDSSEVEVIDVELVDSDDNDILFIE
ncbi:ubiquitin-conjugating enzyme E2 [Lignipirellula cremea]|uniref:Ubiquitin-conjugating enzyme n=1 Tax=Lignipirellula cremea TaxID=2528010 RepID=A0A518DXY7_9BACT|nr:ubiquitin-conjugating enzyme E2 [Lignipirellula cremea]QDU96708.1 Ubiquitin-conjugating enzyme [Lignipirellula cremea]